jgi:hypothetical protein
MEALISPSAADVLDRLKPRSESSETSFALLTRNWPILRDFFHLIRSLPQTTEAQNAPEIQRCARNIHEPATRHGGKRRDVPRKCRTLFSRVHQNEDACEYCESARLLNRIGLGSGCWLDDVRMAIYLAREDFPPHYAYFYQQFVGAAAMAQSYLANLDWLGQVFGSNFVSFLRT